MKMCSHRALSCTIWFLIFQAGTTASSAYIGASDAKSEGTATWLDGSLVSFESWGTSKRMNAG